MSLVGRWECRRQERDHSLQMKRTCEDERDLCDLHTCDRLKVSTSSSDSNVFVLGEEHGCVLAHDLVYATQCLVFLGDQC